MTTGANEQTGEATKTQQAAQEETGKIYTKAELDAAITKALDTRAENVTKIRADYERKLQEEREANERKQLEEQHKYKELYERSEKDRQRLELQTRTSKLLTDKNMTSLASIFDQDITTVQGREQFLDVVQKQVEALTEQKIAERLKHNPPAKTGTAPGPEGIPDPRSPEYKEWRKKQGFQ